MNLEQIKQALLQALYSLNLLRMEPRLKLYQAAFDSLDTDASPSDVAPDEYGCAESVWTLIRQALKLKLGAAPILSTKLLLIALRQSKYFMQVQEPLPGDIIICATGTGNGTLLWGHCGIVGRNTAPDGSVWIMSNDSVSGTFKVNYTLKSWTRHYYLKGGFPINYFRPVNI